MAKAFVNICLKCINAAKALGEDTHTQIWSRVLCKTSTKSNAGNHRRRKHGESAVVKAHFDAKQQRSGGVATLYSSSNGKISRMPVAVSVQQASDMIFVAHTVSVAQEVCGQRSA